MLKYDAVQCKTTFVKINPKWIQTEDPHNDTRTSGYS